MSKNKSPLRYPGGKTRAIKILESYVHKYYPDTDILLSPFLGGASFEIFMQDKGYTVYGNDLFHPLFVFWNVVQNRQDELVDSVKAKMPVTKDVFMQLRNSILDLTDELEIATNYYIINRCSFSGSTFCGGFSLEASTKRLNDSSLKTLKTVNIQNIHLSNKDSIEFLREHPDNPETLIYADPPYYIETYIYGKDGDMHETFNHESFSIEIKKRRNWILSYNDCEYIRNLYAGCQIFKEKWAYGMNSSKESKEIVILPPLEN